MIANSQQVEFCPPAEEPRRSRKIVSPKKQRESFLGIFSRYRKRYGKRRAIVFIEDGVASCYYTDATRVSMALGMTAGRLERNNKTILRLSFPASVLERNRRILAKAGIETACVYCAIESVTKPAYQISAGSTSREAKHLPSPREIAQACKAIQAGQYVYPQRRALQQPDAWTEEEQARRAGTAGVETDVLANIGKVDRRINREWQFHF